MELIKGYSSKAYLTQRLDDLDKRITQSTPRPALQPKTGRSRALKRRVGRGEITEIIAKYQAGISTNQLMREHHLAKRTIATLLKANSVTMRRQGLSDRDTAEAATLYKEGRSLAWIATNHFGGISPTTISRALRNRGIPLHGRGGRCK